MSKTTFESYRVWYFCSNPLIIFIGGTLCKDHHMKISGFFSSYVSEISKNSNQIIKITRFLSSFVSEISKHSDQINNSEDQEIVVANKQVIYFRKHPETFRFICHYHVTLIYKSHKNTMSSNKVYSFYAFMIMATCFFRQAWRQHDCC